MKLVLNQIVNDGDGAGLQHRSGWPNAFDVSELPTLSVQRDVYFNSLGHHDRILEEWHSDPVSHSMDVPFGESVASSVKVLKVHFD